MSGAESRLGITRHCRATGKRLALLLVLLAGRPLWPSPPESAYSKAARQYAEALLAHGRDHYGPLHTPLFVQMLDLRTLEIPRQRTAAQWRAEMSSWKEDRNYSLWGVSRSNVGWAQDSNLLWDTENIRLFHALSKDLSDPRFAAAADECMRYFLKHCVSPTTGLFAWGHHIGYNVLEDRITGRRHEIQHHTPPWEELWRIDPEAVTREIEGIYRHHITDKRMMAYDRHANFWNGMPERDQGSMLHYLGIFIDAFAFLYQKTHQEKYQDWAHQLLIAYQSKSDAGGLYPDNWTDRQARGLPLFFPVRPTTIDVPWRADWMYTAYDYTRDNRWLDDGNQYLEACQRALSSDPAKRRGGIEDDIAFGEAWLHGYRAARTPRYLENALAAGKVVAGAGMPRTQMAWRVATRLNFFLDLYAETGQRRWLDEARSTGDYALRAFVHPSGLIKGTAIVDRPAYYDAIQGPGMLALALYRLGKAETSPGPAAATASQPRSGDFQAPAISQWSHPSLASNLERVPIKVRLQDPSGIRSATLHYTYGNQVGFSDTRPEVAGDLYTFHIEPPGIAFIGEAAFAVEAFDGSANSNRTLSLWRRLRLVARETGRSIEGRLRLPSLGLSFSDVPGSATAQVETARWLPDGAQAPQRGWVSMGRYFRVKSSFDRATLTVSYPPEETHRLIEATLRLACWDGAAWRRVPSQVDAGRKTVSGAFRKAEYWTLLAEDRVLWRAEGRETGPVLADLDHDGALEIVTTRVLPGELLSSQGALLAEFPMDAPYRPVANFSSPGAAAFAPGAEPLLLFGAPSGFVYAYDRTGKLHWRSEVGGEVLGAPAVGALLAGGKLAIAVAWEGGVTVLDPQGRRVWQKELPVPSASTPVLVDLDGDGRQEVLVDAGSKIVALGPESGRVLWEFSAPGRRLTIPAAGEFVRGGKPRVVTGDDEGAVYALDEAGKLLWRQDRIYGPREVPEPIEQFAGVHEVGLADLDRRGQRQVIVTTKSGETVALSARGERLWRFTSYERKLGVTLNRGAWLAFADLDDDGELEVVLSQQDSYLYVLDARGREKWTYLCGFWYHFAPAIGDLRGTGELNVVFTSPEQDGTYALRSGVRGRPGRVPWPMKRGGLSRTNCAPW